MKKDLFRAVITLLLLAMAVIFLIVPEHAPKWFLRLTGAYFLINAITEGVILYKEYRNSKVINKAIEK